MKVRVRRKDLEALEEVRKGMESVSPANTPASPRRLQRARSLFFKLEKHKQVMPKTSDHTVDTLTSSACSSVDIVLPPLNTLEKSTNNLPTPTKHPKKEPPAKPKACTSLKSTGSLAKTTKNPKKESTAKPSLSGFLDSNREKSCKLPQGSSRSVAPQAPGKRATRQSRSRSIGHGENDFEKLQDVFVAYDAILRDFDQDNLVRSAPGTGW